MSFSLKNECKGTQFLSYARGILVLSVQNTQISSVLPFKIVSRNIFETRCSKEGFLSMKWTIFDGKVHPFWQI